MKNSLFVKATLILLSTCTSLFAGNFLRNNDFHFWLFDGFQKTLTEDITFYFNSEFRYGDNASELYLTYVQSGLIISPCHWLDIDPGYRQLYLLDPKDREWIPVYVPLLDITTKLNVGKWRIHDRHRFQYLFIDGVSNLWEYRNRLKLISPWKIGKIGLNPWTFNEVFFRENEGYVQNRFTIGSTIPLTEITSINLFYMLRHFKFIEITQWKHFHTLGLYLHFHY